LISVFALTRMKEACRDGSNERGWRIAVIAILPGVLSLQK
jgi:hypothetical protein